MFRRIPLTVVVVVGMLASLLTATAMADHEGKELTFNQQGLLPITADDFSDVQEECEGVDTDVEDGWVFIHPPVPRGGFTHLDITFDTIGDQDLGDAAHTNEQGSKVTFTAPLGSALTAAEAWGQLAGHDHFVLTHTCHKEQPGFLMVQKFIDVDVDGLLGGNDVSSGDSNLNGWLFNIYAGDSTAAEDFITQLSTGDDDDGKTETIPLAPGNYTVLEVNTGKTITTAVTGGSVTEVTTDNPQLDDVVAGETTTYTFGNACVITKVFEVTGVVGGPNLVAWYDDTVDGVMGAGATMVVLSDPEPDGTFSGIAPDTFQDGDTIEWGYGLDSNGDGDLADEVGDNVLTVGSETFAWETDGYPDCLRVNETQFNNPEIHAFKFKDADDDGDTEDLDGELDGWQITVYASDGVTVVDQGVTGDDGDGQVNFTGLEAGATYVVCETLQDDWLQTYPSDTDTIGIPGDCHQVTLGIGETAEVEFLNSPLSEIRVGFTDLTGYTNVHIVCTDSNGDTVFEYDSTTNTTPEDPGAEVVDLDEIIRIAQSSVDCSFEIVDP